MTCSKSNLGPLPLGTADAPRSVGSDPAFTNALAALTACVAQQERGSASSAEEEHSPEFQAASEACSLAWDAVVACADAFAARRVVQFAQEKCSNAD